MSGPQPCPDAGHLALVLVPFWDGSCLSSWADLCQHREYSPLPTTGIWIGTDVSLVPEVWRRGSARFAARDGGCQMEIQHGRVVLSLFALETLLMRRYGLGLVRALEQHLSPSQRSQFDIVVPGGLAHLPGARRARSFLDTACELDRVAFDGIAHFLAGNRRLFPLRRAKMVATIHEHDAFGDTHRSSLRRAGRRYTTESLFSRLDRIIAVSAQAQRELAEHFGGVDERVVLIPRGVDEWLYHPAPAAERDELRRRAGLRREYWVVVQRGDEDEPELAPIISSHAALKERRTDAPALVVLRATDLAAIALESGAPVPRLAADLSLVDAPSASVWRALVSGARAVILLGDDSRSAFSAAEIAACGAPLIAPESTRFDEYVPLATLRYQRFSVDSLLATLDADLERQPPQVGLDPRFGWSNVLSQLLELYRSIAPADSSN